MGTRADFYMGRGADAEWLGSIAWDGYPEGIPDEIFAAETAESWREEVTKFLADRKDRSLPSDGWPWPWNDSTTTDYAYAWDDGVKICGFGHAWVTLDGMKSYNDACQAWNDAGDYDIPEVEIESFSDGTPVVFPQMERGRPIFGPHSGIIALIETK